jgi:hypothetical protein
MMQGHRLVNDELRQLIRNQDENEPADDDFEFFSQETLRVPGSSKRVLTYRESEAGQKCLKTLL